MVNIAFHVYVTDIEVKGLTLLSLRLTISRTQSLIILSRILLDLEDEY
jgi:hypothetical protein